MDKKKKEDSKVLYRIDITYLPDGNIHCTSIDNYAKYKNINQVFDSAFAYDKETEKNTTEGIFTKATTIEELIQKTLEDNFDIKTRAYTIQLLVDYYDIRYAKAASLYNKFAESRKTKQQ